MQLYYSTENTREFREVEEQSLEVGSAEDQNFTTAKQSKILAFRSMLSWRLRWSTLSGLILSGPRWKSSQ